MSFSEEKRSVLQQNLLQAIRKESMFSPAKFAKEQCVSVQTVYRYLEKMDGDLIEKDKVGNRNRYSLKKKMWTFIYDANQISEDSVWRNDIRPLLCNMGTVALNNSNYAFTEMLNNAIEHSGGRTIRVIVRSDVLATTFVLWDDGVGIFKKIAQAMMLEEIRFAVLELAKGKFTTDPQSHTGEGIFFSSKAVDEFGIWSDGLLFVPVQQEDSDSILTNSDIDVMNNCRGTVVIFTVEHDHSQHLKEIFDRYTAAPEDYGFSKTVVPVRLLEYGDDCPTFISRSQAKRLIARFEKFALIDLNFDGVDSIGQGFADEIFRVFRQAHPETEIRYHNCSTQVMQMIRHVIGE